MPPSWQGTPKRWRVQGKAVDGLTVTLGRYDTEAEATAERDKLIQEGVYRDVKVAPIAPSATPPVPQ
jgi:hypothetical protein